MQRARRVTPGGVNSPVRAWKAVGVDPFIVARGAGCLVYDEDGAEFLDLICSWGPLIAGHAHPDVVSATTRAVERGTSFGIPSRVETELAEEILRRVPTLERVRLVTSGTEATMTALRIARASTGRDKILKFAGCYHGHSNELLVRAGSGVATLGVPDSAGVPTAVSALTVVAEFNDLSTAREILARRDIAAVIVEPIPANMGVVAPLPGYLEGLVEAARAAGTLVIFDEVISGFRVAAGGAQELLGLTGDLVCFGKVIGGGVPLAAVAGRADLLELLAPIGPVYQAGTLAGSPLACAAGLATLGLLDAAAYRRLEQLGARLEAGLLAAIADHGIRAAVQRVGSLLTLFFGVSRVENFRGALETDTAVFGQFFRGMLEHGILIPPSQFEAWFLSLSHGEAEIDRIVAAADHILGGFRT